MTNPIVKKFTDLGNSASYHYADDSTREWDIAHRQETEALVLFDENPDLQDEMRKAARGFLWSLNIKRPKDDS